MIDYTFNFWDIYFNIIGVLVSGVVAYRIYNLTNQLSQRDIYENEKRITDKIYEIGLGSSIIIADVKKYNSSHSDLSDSNYTKQGAEIYTITENYGVNFILRGSDGFSFGTIPFEWIHYIRTEGDNEDNKPIIVCDFKGIKWYKNFRSSFKEIGKIYKNQNYDPNNDPPFLEYTRFK